MNEIRLEVGKQYLDKEGGIWNCVYQSKKNNQEFVLISPLENPYWFDINGWSHGHFFEDLIKMVGEYNPDLKYGEWLLSLEKYGEWLLSLEKDDIVEVEDLVKTKCKRYFSHLSNSKLFCYSHGASSLTAVENDCVTCWEFVKHPDGTLIHVEHIFKSLERMLNATIY